MSDDVLKGIQINSAGFGTISKLAMQDRRLNIAAKAVYAYFNSFAGSGDSCFPSRAKICYDLGISNNSLSKYIKQLVECGYIEVEQIKVSGRFSHNLYTLNATIDIESDSPQHKKQYTKIFDTENLGDENLHTNNNSINNNNISKNNNTIIEKRKQASKTNFTTFNEIIESYTQNQELQISLKEFIKMRALIKKKLTDHALKLLLNKLDKLATSDTDKIAIVDQSITNSWAGFFEVRQQTKQPIQQPKQETEEQRRERELNEAVLAKFYGKR